MKHKNVDPQEIAKFDAIAKDWWNPNGKMKPLHVLNPVRLDYIKQFTALTAKKIIDVGCGGGILTESLARKADHVTGIDLSFDVIEIAKQHAVDNQLTIDYQIISAETLATTHPASFDIVTCMEMLEHVPEPAKIIEACAKLVKPGGFVFFSTIHRNPKSFLMAIVGAEHVLNLLPRGTHTYANFIRPSELDQWASAAKLTLKDLSGIQYSPFKNKAALSRDISVNYLACYQPIK